MRSRLRWSINPLKLSWQTMFVIVETSISNVSAETVGAACTKSIVRFCTNIELG